MSNFFDGFGAAPPPDASGRAWDEELIAWRVEAPTVVQVQLG